MQSAERRSRLEALRHTPQCMWPDIKHLAPTPTASCAHECTHTCLPSSARARVVSKLGFSCAATWQRTQKMPHPLDTHCHATASHPLLACAARAAALCGAAGLCASCAASAAAACSKRCQRRALRQQDASRALQAPTAAAAQRCAFPAQVTPLTSPSSPRIPGRRCWKQLLPPGLRCRSRAWPRPHRTMPPPLHGRARAGLMRLPPAALQTPAPRLSCWPMEATRTAATGAQPGGQVRFVCVWGGAQVTHLGVRNGKAKAVHTLALAGTCCTWMR
jgi:hypothetical protein